MIAWWTAKWCFKQHTISQYIFWIPISQYTFGILTDLCLHCICSYQGSIWPRSPNCVWRQKFHPASPCHIKLLVQFASLFCVILLLCHSLNALTVTMESVCAPTYATSWCSVIQYSLRLFLLHFMWLRTNLLHTWLTCCCDNWIWKLKNGLKKKASDWWRMSTKQKHGGRNRQRGGCVSEMCFNLTKNVLEVSF